MIERHGFGQEDEALNPLRAYCNTSLSDRLNAHRTASSDDHVIALFHAAAQNVPAYAAFLSEHGIDAAAVRSIDDFRELPLLTKDNYLRRYPLPQLCRHGRLQDCDMVAVSSGSTGEPAFWPRSVADELEVAWRFEQVFADSFGADGLRTLALVCFALGTWVGGVYTLSCCRHLAAKGYPITVLAPGNNKEEILRVFTRLAPHYDQVVLLGYPPFLKEVIDTGRSRATDWRQRRIRLVFAGEVFSEEWRDVVLERVGAQDPLRDSASLYGTADGGVLGNETPLSIAVRRWFSRHPQAAREMFGESRLPTLVQYDPLSRYFECRNGTLIFSCDNGIPLLRYHLADEGGLLSFAEMMERLSAQSFDPLRELARAGIGVRELPFVYVFGRSHFVLSYFGANIYPENLSVGLEQPEVRDWVTGKFVMEVREDVDHNQHFHVVVELAPGEATNAARMAAVAGSLRAQLLRLNSEFANYVPPDYQTPLVELKTTGDKEWFPPGVKHRYSRR